MAKRVAPRPTDAELAILRVLWRRGPSTVRQVQEALEQLQPTGYTTALKLLHISDIWKSANIAEPNCDCTI